MVDKKTAGGAVKNETMQNKELAEELHKPITTKLEKRKVHSSFLDNIWGADLADVQLLRKFRFLLCVIDIYSKYAWVILLKDKICITIINAFKKNLDESNRKSELENIAIEMYSKYNEGKPVVDA